MKKTFIFLLSMILVLSIGQAVFANYELGLIVGYGNKNETHAEYMRKTNSNIDMPLIGIYGEHEFKEGCFISFKEKISFGEYITKFIYPDNESLADIYDTMEIYFDLFLKMNILTTASSRIGLQIGVMDDYMRLKLTQQMPTFTVNAARDTVFNIDKFNTFFMAVGAYADIKVNPNVTVYGDLKIPILSTANDAFKEKFMNYYYGFDAKDFLGFFKSFLYDLTLGLRYDVNPKVYLGIEGTITNATVFDLSHTISNELQNGASDANFPTFNIGATIGYRF